MTSEPSRQTGVGKGSQADFMAQMTFASMGSSCTDPSCTDSFCGRPSGVREAKETSFRRSRGNFFTKLFDGGRREVDDEDLGLGLLEKGRAAVNDIFLDVELHQLSLPDVSAGQGFFRGLQAAGRSVRRLHRRLLPLHLAGYRAYGRG